MFYNSNLHFTQKRKITEYIDQRREDENAVISVNSIESNHTHKHTKKESEKVMEKMLYVFC